MSKRDLVLRGLCLRWGVHALEAEATARETVLEDKVLKERRDTLEKCRAELETVLGIRAPEPLPAGCPSLE